MAMTPTPSAVPAVSPPATAPSDPPVTMENIRYQVSGCAAHGRLVPLLPSDWVDESPYSNSTTTTRTNAIPDFLWENAPRKETRAYRDLVKCYSHLPNGTAVLDDKWALARLFSLTKHEKLPPHFATLESHCFRGISGFQAFCDRVRMNKTKEEELISDDKSTCQFPDLLNANDMNVDATSPAPPSNLWVVKDANSNGAGGIWIVGPQNAADFTDSVKTPLLEEHRYVAQRYAWPPVLYGGRKCHVRVYGLMTSDGRAFVHKRAFLHVANEPFVYPSSESDFAESVHITNCCANSHDETKFAGEICADFDATEFGDYQGQTVVPLQTYFPSISASVEELARRAFPFLRGGEANNGFEYLGIDFILSHDEDNTPEAYMLEVNAPPSQDTATGLSHAESLHDDVIRDILTLWVFPNVVGTPAVENLGGWKCVLDERQQDIVSEDSLIVPSKAAILNKIRWAIYERKSSKIYDEASGDEQSNEAANGKEIAAATISGDAVAAFARTQFPYFNKNPDDSSSSSSPQQIFFENAGGAQVPRQVIDAVSSSLSHRNRCVTGTRTKKAAKKTLSTILGATQDEHVVFLAANASSLFEKLAHLYVETGLLSRDDEIVVCTENHLANVTPWLTAARSVGATVKWWHVEGTEKMKQYEDDESKCHSRSLRDLLSSKTRILAISHASNILGQVRDLEAVCKLAKDISDGYIHVVADGVAAVPHLSASVAKSGVDWYAISCHKLFGPHIGALCGRKRSAELLYNASGCGETLYKMIESGTTSYEACAGIQGLGRYFQALATFSGQPTLSNLQQTRNQCTESQQDRYENPSPQRTSLESLAVYENTELTESLLSKAYDRIKRAETPLIDQLHKRLNSCDNVYMIESSERQSLAKLPVFSFLHRLIPSSEIFRQCSDAGIMCRQSSFLSTAALQEAFGFGTSSPQKGEEIVRVSLAHYNTVDEVNQLMDTLESLPNWWVE